MMAHTTLRFVESEERYSTYLDAEGEEVYLQHGTAKRLVHFDEIWDRLHELWQEFHYSHVADPIAFQDVLRDMTIEPDLVDDMVFFCADCRTPGAEEDLYFTNQGHSEVCESCLDDYWTCTAGCDERFRVTTTTLHDTEVCTTCRENHWSYCEDCDGYHRDSDAGEHEHDEFEDEDCGECESPQMSFTVRNDGEGPLANDTRATVTLPAGVITTEGVGTIARYLREWADIHAGHDPTIVLLHEQPRNRFHQLSYRLDELGDRWQAKDGNYTKRLSRFAYKMFGLKIEPEVISHVGNIAREHSTAVDHQIETTRNLNLPRSEFAHNGSCWWTEYSESRCAFKTNGGFGLRTFSDEGDYSRVVGRAWVMPLRLDEDERLVPTFETQNPDAFAVFNGYGNLEGYTPARIVSHMAGMTYRKIEFKCSPMYVNNSSGYLIAPEEIATHYTDGSLHLTVAQHSNLFHNEKVLTNA